MRNSMYGVMAAGLIVLFGCSAEMAKQGDSPQFGAGGADSGEHYAAVFTSDSFQQDVLNSSQVVLVDCWAPWCGPCLQLGPTIEELAREYEGKAVVGKLNVDDAQEISREYEISGIPALLFFKGGQEVDRLVGVQPKSEIAAKLDSLISGSRP